MKAKNAIIITYYNAPNYGAFLQAYATQEYLKKHGIDAHILSHKANEPNLFTGFLDKRVIPETLQYRNQLQLEIDKVQSYLNMGNGVEEYDVAIIGSDEIWNVKNLTARHLPIFFKPYKRARKTIAYSACAGKCEVKHMKLFPYTAGIRRLDAVAVRDEHTEKLAYDFGISDVCRTLDPTFLNDFSQDIPNRIIPEEYILVYTYGLSTESIKVVCDYASKKKLKIVATGSNCNWADSNPIVSPFEWLSLIKYSACVVTSTFHGSVFSIILGKQFVVVDTESNKVKSLLEELRLVERKADTADEIIAVIETPMDYDKVNKVVEKRREESADFLLDHF